MKHITEMINKNKVAFGIIYFKPDRCWEIVYTMEPLVGTSNQLDDGPYKEYQMFMKNMKKLKSYHDMDNCMSIPDKYKLPDDKQQLIDDIIHTCDNAVYSSEFETYAQNNF